MLCGTNERPLNTERLIMFVLIIKEDLEVRTAETTITDIQGGRPSGTFRAFGFKIKYFLFSLECIF